MQGEKGGGAEGIISCLQRLTTQRLSARSAGSVSFALRSVIRTSDQTSLYMYVRGGGGGEGGGGEGRTQTPRRERETVIWCIIAWMGYLIFDILVEYKSI